MRSNFGRGATRSADQAAEPEAPAEEELWQSNLALPTKQPTRNLSNLGGGGGCYFIPRLDRLYRKPYACWSNTELVSSVACVGRGGAVV